MHLYKLFYQARCCSKLAVGRLTVPWCLNANRMQCQVIYQSRPYSNNAIRRTGYSTQQYMVLGASLVLGGVLAANAGTVQAAATPATVILSVQLLLQQADQHYNNNQFDEVYNLLEPHKGGRNEEVLWRLARACYKRAKASKDASLSKDLLKEALVHAQAALAINESNFAVHKWMAILVDEVAALEGSKARILQSFVMKEHMEKACELNPKDGTSWYLLGMWHYNIADIPWYTRKAAAVLFATPPQSTFEEALKVFLHAEQVEPNFYSENLLMIGRCYQRLQERQLAVQYLRRARDYRGPQLPTQEDATAAQEAALLLQKLGDK